MNQKVTFALACTLAVFSSVTASPPSIAKSPDEPDWWQDTESKIRAIYERAEFRSKEHRVTWEADSSAFTLRSRDVDSGEMRRRSYNASTGKPVEQDAAENTPANNRRVRSPDGTQVIEFRDGGLFVRDVSGGRQSELVTHSDERDIRYRDPTWSPDGKRILFVEADQTEVPLRSVLVPSDPSYPGVKNSRFARVGETITSLRVGVVDADGQNLTWLPIESPKEGFYIGQVDWAGNSDEVLVETFSRFRDKREFFLVRLGQQPKRIYHESNAAWAIGSQEISSGLSWIRGGESFIVVSEKDGWRHAAVYSRDGKQHSLLTQGDYDIIDRAIVDEAGGWYYFYASPSDGTSRYLFRVPLDGSGTLEQVSPEAQSGTHHYDFSPDARWAIHTFSTMDSPPIIELVELQSHRVISTLEDNSALRSKMDEVIKQPTEFLSLDIGQGISLDAWMIKPDDFDASKKYPVFVYVYGEPYAQTVLNQWGTHHAEFHRVIANLGYLVISIDNRGTPAPKGAAWRRSIFGSLGPLSTEEQAAGLKELARTRPYVDLSRVGIWGWSGGGSNTLNAMFRKPDTYHVGIAVVPKPQPHLYNAWFQEIYMRTREVNREGYERAAPINFADGLEGKLLMITGSGETNTHIQIIEGLVDRLIRLGKSFDYMVYPNRDHGLREGQGTTVHVRMLIIRYLREHLPPGPR